MEFQELQEKIYQNALNYGERFNVEIDEDFALLKLYEEAGELAQAVLIHNKKSRPEKHIDRDASKQRVAEELADVMGMAIVIAKVMNIDILEALNHKWLKE